MQKQSFLTKNGMFKNLLFKHPSFKGIGKMLQNEQTEPVGVTRSCTMVQREVKFVHSKKALNQGKTSNFEVFLRFILKFNCRTQTNIYILLPFCVLGYFNIHLCYSLNSKSFTRGIFKASAISIRVSRDEEQAAVSIRCI